MAWRRKLMEGMVWLANRMHLGTRRRPAGHESIFVLRNNDLGDLLVVTPLFHALRRQFPATRIVVGIGQWATEVLEGNPYIDQAIVFNAPWKNKFVEDQSLGAALRYIWASQQSREIVRQKFDIGIDVLGSQLGSLFMMRARIPYRLGVRGYGGGHTAVHQYVEYDGGVHVGRAALGFAELLGCTDLPPNRPQIFLSEAEQRFGHEQWVKSGTFLEKPMRIVLGPGGGLPEKRWPLDYFVQLVRLLEQRGDAEIIIVGGEQDLAAGKQIASGSKVTYNRAGSWSLRKTFAVVAAADLVISNSSMLMHAAAAFQINTVVVLGPSFESAKQHQRQWGYPGTCVCLGKEMERPQIAKPGQAFEVACQFLDSEMSSASVPIYL